MNKQVIARLKKMKLPLPSWHRHPLVVPVGVFFGMFFVSLGLFISFNATTLGASDVRVVNLSIDGQKQSMPTRADTVGQLLERLEIELKESDIIEPSLDSEILENDFTINIYRSRTVLIVDGEERTYIDTASPSARSVVSEASIEVHPEDIVEKDTSEPIDALDVLQEGVISERLVIKRSIPVNLNFYGKTYELRTHAATVGELLAERQLELRDDDDTLKPSADTAISNNLLIYLARIGIEIEVAEEEIPAPTETVDDSNMTFGTTEIREAGSPGLKAITYEIEMRNGKEYDRSVIQEVVLVEPKPQIIVRGTKTISRSNQAILYDLRMCETGGNYQTNTGNGFYGGYQFMRATWDSIARLSNRPDLIGVSPDQAAPADQDYLTLQNGRISGFHSQYPGCSQRLSLPNRPS